MMHQPLKGIKVVELGIFAAAPMCAKVLGDWGADIIKVESLAGDPSRTSGAANYGLKVGDPYENPAYENRNLNSRSITLDLKSEDGLQAMYDLLATADVYITNMRHKTALEEALDSLKMVENSIEMQMPEDFFSIDLMNAYEALGSIIGEAVGEDLVNEIFSKFCTGK